MSEPVWRDVVHACTRCHLVYHRTYDTRINAAALIPQKERMPTALPGQLRTASNQPMVESVGSGRPVGNHPFFISFAEDTHGEGLPVER